MRGEAARRGAQLEALKAQLAAAKEEAAGSRRAAEEAAKREATALRDASAEAASLRQRLSAVVDGIRGACRLLLRCLSVLAGGAARLVPVQVRGCFSLEAPTTSPGMMAWLLQLHVPLVSAHVCRKLLALQSMMALCAGRLGHPVARPGGRAERQTAGSCRRQGGCRSCCGPSGAAGGSSGVPCLFEWRNRDARD